MKVRYATFPPGMIEIVSEGDAIVSVRKVIEKTRPETDAEILSACEKALTAYFGGERELPVPELRLCGTAFEKAVWGEIARIPYGETRTYFEIAKAIGNAKAVRAVGRACGKNPVWILIPCHRVVGKSGRLTGYAGGLEMKKMLLDFEKENSCPK